MFYHLAGIFKCVLTQYQGGMISVMIREKQVLQHIILGSLIRSFPNNLESFNSQLRKILPKWENIRESSQSSQQTYPEVKTVFSMKNCKNVRELHLRLGKLNVKIRRVKSEKKDWTSVVCLKRFVEERLFCHLQSCIQPNHKTAVWITLLPH